MLMVVSSSIYINKAGVRGFRIANIFMIKIYVNGNNNYAFTCNKSISKYFIILLDMGSNC